MDRERTEVLKINGMQRNQQYVFKSLHHKDIELLSLMLDFLVDSQKKERFIMLMATTIPHH